MAAIFQIRRGTTNETLADGELYLHKGSGSVQFGSGSTAVTLLPLNVPIVGNINLSGSISASGDIRLGGNIYLGDNIANDSVNVNSAFSGSIIPSGSNVFDLGSTTLKYRNVHATSISGAIAATNGVISGSSQIALSLPQGVVSGSSQVIEILGSLNTYTGSNDSINTTQNGRLDQLSTASGSAISRLSTLEVETNNLQGFSSSVDTRLTEIGVVSGSLILSASVAKTTNDSQGVSITNINSTTASLNTSVTELNTFSGSQLTKDSNLATYTGSVNTQLTEIGVITGSLILSASADKVSITNLNSYTSSLKTAIGVSGVDVTVLGNLTVNGTTTQINSTQVNIGDNILELNFGGSATEAGIYTKDTTGASLVSGSLLWDSTNDQWKAGIKNLESKLLLAGGDSVLSGSSQITLENVSGFSTFNTTLSTITGSLILSASAAKTTNDSQDISITNLNTFSGSTLTRLSALEIETNNLEGFSSSVLTRLTEIGIVSGSLITSASVAKTTNDAQDVSITNLNSFTGSQLTQNSNLATYTGSVNTRLTEVGVVSGSLIASASAAKSSNDSQGVSITNLNSFSGSQITQNNTLGIYTASVENKFSTLSTYTASIDTRFTTLSSVTASLIAATASLYGSASNHEARLDELEYTTSINLGSGAQVSFTALNLFTASVSGTNLFTSSVNIRLGLLETSTGSLNSFTSSINTTIKSKLNTDGVISGSSQITSLLPLGVVSGSSQITYANISSIPIGIISSSAQVNADSITNFDTNVKDKLNADGVISGSSQIITANSVTLGTHTTGNYVATIAGTTNQIIVAGSGLETAAITLSTPQDIHTSANPQFNSLGIGTAASGVSGEIRATADITAFYSSDERLKSNIQPISDALAKVNRISGNVYDWKDGFENIHSHTGTDIGVIAQEIEKVLPQIVTNRDNGYKAVQYEKIIPLLIEAIKELSNKIDKLENK